MPTPYNTKPLRALLTDDEVVGNFRNQVGAAIARAQNDSLTPISNHIELHHHVGGLGQVLATSWAIEAAKAWQEVHVAMAITLQQVPRTAIAEAMGLASGNNFRTKFPQLEEIMECIKRELNTGREIRLTARGFEFTVGPLWYAEPTDDDAREPSQNDKD